MLTYALQWVVGILTLAFAVLAIGMARAKSPGNPSYAFAWRLVGVTFLLHAACQMAQYAWGGMALRGGAKSEWMTSYLLWAPAFNHSRTFVLAAMYVALMVLAIWRVPSGPVFMRAYLGGLVLALGCGILLGTAEGSLVESRHYLRVAGLDTLELVVALCALFASLVRDRVDRYLWGALAVKAFTVALSIIWFAVLSQINNPNVWSPAPWQIAGYRVVLSLVMVALAARCLWRARRGFPASGLIAGDSRQVPTFAH